MTVRIGLILLLAMVSVSSTSLVVRSVATVPALVLAFWRMFTASGMLWSYSVIRPAGKLSPINKKRIIFIMKKFEIIFNWILFKIIPSSTNFETLTLVFDGNTVNARGVWHSINKLKKRLKILELL